MNPVVRIISGGQTGADRAALDFAIAHGIPHGGWCPADRLAEDGRIPSRYRLPETPDSDYAQRTEWNVRDSDGTVIFSTEDVLTGGSKFTLEMAAAQGKPCLHLSSKAGSEAAAGRLRAFLETHRIKCLNVAGPRASQDPGVGAFVFRTLQAALAAPEPGLSSRSENAPVPRRTGEANW